MSEPNLSRAGFPTLRFRFAKTMAHIPHWYVVRSPENEADYVRLFNSIAEYGVWEEWRDGKKYQYWRPGDSFQSWRMDSDVNKSKVINRTLVNQDDLALFRSPFFEGGRHSSK